MMGIYQKFWGCCYTLAQLVTFLPIILINIFIIAEKYVKLCISVKMNEVFKIIKPQNFAKKLVLGALPVIIQKGSEIAKEWLDKKGTEENKKLK